MTSFDTVFLDRDGVLNEKLPEGQFVASWNEFKLLPGVSAAIARLNGAGIRVVVVSNQRGVALGLYTMAEVEAIHARLQDELANHNARIDAFFVCPHERGQCQCRKPLPGLFEQAVERFAEIRADRAVMVGDSPVDIEFGRNLGMRTVLIDGGGANSAPGMEQARAEADAVCVGLAEAVEKLLG